ncbi:MAG: 16S rRNA (cytidine(1402)-2'-O)-methyltransferase [Kiritimatiellae bacterium]|nr:16S rRNA (cytidine(1402)-2'-O)-methyltransferase [Kiritimatiellia bacterium]
MLFLVATPIGNLEDMTLRAVRVLREADVIACEDTRRTRTLLSHFGIHGPPQMLSYREQTEEHAGEQIGAFLAQGKTVAVCTDAGYPGISDPGYRLVRLAVERGWDLQVIPGASAVPLALIYSGLPSSSYTFKGYPPRRKGACRQFFLIDREAPHTLVLFESPRRVLATLQTAWEVLGDRLAAVCFELTKLHEHVIRGHLEELIARLRNQSLRGEVTIVIAGNNPKFIRSTTPGTNAPTISPTNGQPRCR